METLTYIAKSISDQLVTHAVKLLLQTFSADGVRVSNVILLTGTNRSVICDRTNCVDTARLNSTGIFTLLIEACKLHRAFAIGRAFGLGRCKCTISCSERFFMQVTSSSIVTLVGVHYV